MRAAGMRYRQGGHPDFAKADGGIGAVIGKLNIRLKIIQPHRENRVFQIAVQGLAQACRIIAKTVKPHFGFGVEKRFEKRQAANMVGVEMRKTNINFRATGSHHFGAQMHQA